MSSLGVIGLGYVGLPLAVQAAEKGYDVVGIDLDKNIVDKVNKRQSTFVNDLRFNNALKLVNRESLFASTDIRDIKSVDNIVICVPTPTENNIPDMRYVTDAAKQIAAELQSGQFVALESTVNPGITRDVVLPILEKESGLKVGEDFYLAHCPERIDPGNEKYFVGNLNRVVGGITPACTQKAMDFYTSIIDANVTPLGSTEEAEFVKSWENSHRNIMIAMANTAAIICDALDMDIDNILEGLQSKIDQFGLNLARPGIGPGGHCIPEDIHYVIKKARQKGVDTRFLDDAAELNDKMPDYASHSFAKLVQLNGERLKDLNVALLGLAYKPNVDDMRRSPTVEVGFNLLRKVKGLTLHDPFITSDKFASMNGTKQAKSLDEALDKADAIFIGTAHGVYVEKLTAKNLKKHGIRFVFDGRNCLDKKEILSAGIAYKGVGK